MTGELRRLVERGGRFRRAKYNLGLNLNLIEQKLEGELGYLAASSARRLDVPSLQYVGTGAPTAVLPTGVS